jgi:hypothetical protein
MQFGDLGGLCGVEKFTDPRHVRYGNLVQSAGEGRRYAAVDPGGIEFAPLGPLA